MCGGEGDLCSGRMALKYPNSSLHIRAHIPVAEQKDVTALADGSFLVFFFCQMTSAACIHLLVGLG